MAEIVPFKNHISSFNGAIFLKLAVRKRVFSTMSASLTKKIGDRIGKIPVGELFGRARMYDLATGNNLESTLNTLVMTRVIDRITNGVFMRPSYSQLLKKNVPPAPCAVLTAVSECTGEVIQVHGCEAARRLQLTTQMQIKPCYYTTGRTRLIEYGRNGRISLQHVQAKWTQHAGTKTGLAIAAIYYMGRSGLDAETAKIIVGGMTNREFEKIVQSELPKWAKKALKQAFQRRYS